MPKKRNTNQGENKDKETLLKILKDKGVDMTVPDSITGSDTKKKINKPTPKEALMKILGDKGVDMTPPASVTATPPTPKEALMQILKEKGVDMTPPDSVTAPPPAAPQAPQPQSAVGSGGFGGSGFAGIAATLGHAVLGAAQQGDPKAQEQVRQATLKEPPINIPPEGPVPPPPVTEMVSPEQKKAQQTLESWYKQPAAPPPPVQQPAATAPPASEQGVQGALATLADPEPSGVAGRGTERLINTPKEVSEKYSPQQNRIRALIGTPVEDITTQPPRPTAPIAPPTIAPIEEPNLKIASIGDLNDIQKTYITSKMRNSGAAQMIVNGFLEPGLSTEYSESLIDLVVSEANNETVNIELENIASTSGHDINNVEQAYIETKKIIHNSELLKEKQEEYAHHYAIEKQQFNEFNETTAKELQQFEKDRVAFRQSELQTKPGAWDEIAKIDAAWAAGMQNEMNSMKDLQKVLLEDQQAISEMKVSPKRFWAKASPEAAAMLIIGAGLTAFGASLTKSGDPGAGVKLIQQLVNKDIAIQENAIVAKSKQFESKKAALQAHRSNMLKTVDVKLRQAQSETKDQAMQEKIAIDRQKIQLAAEEALRQSTKDELAARAQKIKVAALEETGGTPVKQIKAPPAITKDVKNVMIMNNALRDLEAQVQKIKSTPWYKRVALKSGMFAEAMNIIESNDQGKIAEFKKGNEINNSDWYNLLMLYNKIGLLVTTYGQLKSGAEIPEKTLERFEKQLPRISDHPEIMTGKIMNMRQTSVDTLFGVADGLELTGGSAYRNVIKDIRESGRKFGTQYKLTMPKRKGQEEPAKTKPKPPVSDAVLID